MPRYVNQNELEQQMEEEFQEADVVAKREAAPKDDAQKAIDWEKRYSDLRSHTSRKETEYQNQLKSLQRQLEGVRNGTVKPPKTKDEIEAYKAQYPEFSEVLDTWINDAVASQTLELKRQALEIKREKALLELKEKHADVQDVLSEGSPFFTWLADQSEAEKNYIYNSFDVKNAAFIIDKYKIENGINKNTTQNDDPRDAARAVKTRGRGPSVDTDPNGYLYSESQIEEMSRKDPKWWDANEEKIMTAQRQGRVLMDMTGAAR